MQDFKIDEHCEQFPVAMAYVPWQRFDNMYEDLEKAYCIGTIFPELNKPFTGRRCVS
ncbi:MAG: spore coat associated protein CotJA [Clostridium sp.]|nr:spore coat associated protein CotJA [Acetatifactor muris]MCM1113573.1 spore coat associated protein CotJA [Muribaculum sp.]MCM1526486.1 spore coat associated protein CotJA [Bacteroides sp.]MCM1562388.1 spore coat associated protein CotJA [Clostridium sp.]